MMLPIVILAGGLATRLRPLTENFPKALIEVAGQPFILHQLKLLKAQGITDIVLCVGYLGEMIEQVVGNGRIFGVNIQYVYDGPVLLGTAGAIRKAIDKLGDTFFVIYGDSYLQCDFSEVKSAFQAQNKLALMTVYRNNNLWDRSNILFKNGHILHYDKFSPTPDMSHIDYGLGILRSQVLEKYPEGIPIDLATVYQDLLRNNQLYGFEVTQRFYEIGSVKGIEELNSHLSKAKVI